MAQIKELTSGHVYTVAEFPQHVAGMWECGDQRFTDPTGTLYAPVGYPSLQINAGHFYSLFTNQQQQDIEASDNSVVKQFLKNVNVLISSGGAVDLGSSAVAAGLGYLAATNVSPATTPVRTYIQASDIARICTNILP